ncbi:methyltransferase-like protein 7A [Penaeus japonicus]|uniref:methyltransferase-like protein 7A n=1 Tax=Penaeus japonicus TaxID=27405 RepID=UPI001C70E9E0|nr:methyltransferase-like protein 7A [Penaeus japonicus]
MLTSLLTWISQNFIGVLAFLAVLWIVKKFVMSTQHRWFAYVMHFCTKDEFPKLEEVKKDHFASMKNHVSHDPELRKKNAIKILEIGVGTGVNFAHYPDDCRLVVVDPNPHFKEYYNENRKKFPNIHSEDILVTHRSERYFLFLVCWDAMHMIEDGSVDAVVITLVLCSVDRIDKILREVRRVLAPGGKFYFMEHVQEFDLKKYNLRKHLQDFFTWCGLWPFIFDGCCLNRDPMPAIESAGFSKVEVDRYYAPVPNFLFWVEMPNVKGVATK